MAGANRGFFWRLGSLIYSFKWGVLVFWIIVTVFLGIFAPKLPEQLNENGFIPPDSESDAAFRNLQEHLGFAPSMLNIVYKSEEDDITDPESTARILESLVPLNNMPYVKEIRINKTKKLNGRTDIQSVLVELDLTSNEALDKFPDIRKKIDPPSGMKVYVDGGTATLYDVQKATKTDMAKAEMLGIPIALIVLLIIFGTVWAALLPLVIGIMSVTLTLGMTYFIAQFVSLSNFLPNIVFMLGLAIGIDYALFFVSRFREELTLESNVRAAVSNTAEKAGKSVFFSGVAVLIGMLGMLFIRLPIMYALCLGGVIVVFSSIVLSITLLPALLSILGHRINSLQVFPKIKNRLGSSVFWEKIAFGVMKRPVPLALGISGFLLLLMFPVGGMKLGVPSAEVLPPSYESRAGADLLKKTYDARRGNPLQIYVETKKPIYEEETISEMLSYSSKLEKVPGAQKISSYITAIGGNTSQEKALFLSSADTRKDLEDARLAKDWSAVITVVPRHDPDSLEAADLVKSLRRVDSGSLKIGITGETAYRVDMIDRISRGLPALVSFIIAVTYIILFFAFKSVLLPLKAVLMNILSLGASLGIVVLVFQKGWFAESLQISAIGYVSIVMPVTIFCIVFGISMDYEVFLISRIMEEYEKTSDNDWSTAAGLKQTGSLITSAALILMVVVGSFIFTDIEITKALGIGLFSAILIDATLIRIIIVPALMKLLGKANWWAPAWIKGR